MDYSPDHEFFEVYQPIIEGCSMGVQYGAGIQSEYHRTEKAAMDRALELAQIVNKESWVAVRRLRVHLGEINPMIKTDDLIVVHPPGDRE